MESTEDQSGLTVPLNCLNPNNLWTAENDPHEIVTADSILRWQYGANYDINKLFEWHEVSNAIRLHSSKAILLEININWYTEVVFNWVVWLELVFWIISFSIWNKQDAWRVIRVLTSITYQAIGRWYKYRKVQKFSCKQINNLPTVPKALDNVNFYM